ncbi:hypothetical protein [Domibacillus aminovorans]|nr:hypothetical protein [Domibacillus aminovorans]
MALSLDAPQESDNVLDINGIKVAVDSQIASTEEFTLDKEESKDSVRLV